MFVEGIVCILSPLPLGYHEYRETEILNNESIVYAAEGWPWYMGKAYPLRPGDQGFKLQEQRTNSLLAGVSHLTLLRLQSGKVLVHWAALIFYAAHLS